MTTTVKFIVEGTNDPEIDASIITIADAGTHFTGTDVETALQEIGVTTSVTTTAITVADESTDTTCFPLFNASSTGLTALKSSTKFTFNSNLYYLGVGTDTPDSPLHITKTNATVVLRMERNDTTIGIDDIVGRIEFENQNTSGAGINATIEALGDGTDGETGLRFTTGAGGVYTEAVRITSAQFVGIGVTEPDTRLHLEDITGAVFRMTRKDTTVSDDDILGRIEFENQDAASSGIAAYVQAEAEGSNGETALVFGTGTADTLVERLRISNTGVILSPDDLHFNCSTGKTIVLDESVYNDANVGSLVLVTGGTLPGVVELLESDGGSSGIYSRGFAVNEQGSGSLEIPHDYKEGTDIVFHVHWVGQDAPSGTDNVRWQLTYSVTRGGVVTPATTTVVAADDTPYDTRYEWVRTDVATITGTDFKIGDQFNFTLTRIAASGDAYAGEAVVATIGFHYQTERLGSRSISAA